MQELVLPGEVDPGLDLPSCGGYFKNLISSFGPVEDLHFASVMPSLRAVLRRYRQVPRTEADGAFNYSRASNGRGLLNSGGFNSSLVNLLAKRAFKTD